MERAYFGHQERRLPIRIKPLTAATYLVMDGNSTAAVAKAAGWRALPCILSLD
jgi:hypothetical protein